MKHSSLLKALPKYARLDFFSRGGLYFFCHSSHVSAGSKFPHGHSWPLLCLLRIGTVLGSRYPADPLRGDASGSPLSAEGTEADSFRGDNKSPSLGRGTAGLPLQSLAGSPALCSCPALPCPCSPTAWLHAILACSVGLHLWLSKWTEKPQSPIPRSRTCAACARWQVPPTERWPELTNSAKGSFSLFETQTGCHPGSGFSLKPYSVCQRNSSATGSCCAQSTAADPAWPRERLSKTRSQGQRPGAIPKCTCATGTATLPA